ncbi:MAG TPA: carboxypeptidase-like regulatory domain-containing protein, partial [Stenomitos sp.]
MRVLPKGIKGIAMVLALSLLSGCDLLLLSPSMPGIVPGLGRALTGRVLDSQTGLPIGKATVTAGWGATNTDNAGNFSLYGDFSGGKNISISRAGYVSVTYALGPVAEGDTYYIDPSFPNSGSLTRRDLKLTGILRNSDNTPMTANGNVSFGGAASSKTNESTGAYGITVTAGLPGSIFSGVLAGGQITGGPVTNQSQPFNYQTFGYRLVDLPSVIPDSTWTATANIQVQNTTFTDM